MLPDQLVQHKHMDCHMATGVLPTATRQTTTHAADRHVGTGAVGAEVAGINLTEMF